MTKKPRGRCTSYGFFVQTSRAEQKKTHPNESIVFGEFSQMCGQKWKTLSNEEKKPFVEMSERDKARYESEMESYQKVKGMNKVPVGRGKKRLPKDFNAPKRSLTAYMLFCNDQRQKIRDMNPDYGFAEIANRMGRLWTELDPTTKQKYEDIAQVDKLRYEKELETYKKGQASPANIDVVDVDDDDE